MQFWKHRQEETLSTLRALKVPIETSQLFGKNSFHNRLITSMQACFDKGFEHVIVVGNDTPDLQLQLLKNTAKKLKRSSTVLQPAEDGGINLIGINRQAFDRIKSAKLPWQKQNLLETLLRKLELKNIDYELLPCGSDLDSVSDLVSHILGHINSNLAKLVAVLLEWVNVCFSLDQALKQLSPYLKSLTGRAPPQLN